MEHFFVETLGFSENVFSYVALPVIIFLARICEVSVNTIRLIYMLGGRRYTSTIMGFFEALIWLVAIRQIFQHLDNWVGYVAYPGGFAAGIFIGMIIEERIAYGKVIVRIITNRDVEMLIEYMHKEKFRYTLLDTKGQAGHGRLVFTVLPRERLDDLLKMLKNILPTAFYTIQNVKTAAESDFLPEERSAFKLFTWLRGIIRN
jgi:uncharacterized protein YebE (UPF0316 family)